MPALRGVNEVALQKAIQLIYYNCSHIRIIKMRMDLRRAGRKECPLLGVKRTCRFALQMSAFDPKRTSASRGAQIFLTLNVKLRAKPFDPSQRIYLKVGRPRTVEFTPANICEQMLAEGVILQNKFSARSPKHFCVFRRINSKDSRSRATF